jgi:hypothetical protein
MIAGLGVVVICALGALIAAVSLLAMALPGRPQPWLIHLLRRAAWLAAASAAAVYALGLTGVLASQFAYDNGADSVPAPACRDGFSTDTVRHLVRHEASYLPLRFDCVRDDGSTYTSDPNYTWMNWTTLLLGVCAALLVIGAGYATEFRARKALRASTTEV